MGAIAFTTTRSQGKVQKILNALHKPKTRRELEEELFCGHKYLIKYIRYMKDNGLIYVSHWRPMDDGRHVPMYSVGNYPDVPKPAPVDRKELSRRQWGKVKSNKELHDDYKEKRNRREALKRTKPFADPLLQWMRV